MTHERAALDNTTPSNVKPLGAALSPLIPGEPKAREGDKGSRARWRWIPFPALRAAGDDT
jgi:hypothetical protein